MKINLSESKAKIDELKKAVAAIDIPLEIDVEIEDDKVSREELDARIDNIWRSIWDLYDDMYKSIMSVRNDLWEYAARHGEGHLPPILGTEKMQKAIDTLGLAGDYEIVKRTVFASETGKKEKIVWTISAKTS